MMGFTLRIVFFIFFIISSYTISAQEAILITRENLASEGLVEDSHPANLACSGSKEALNKFHDIYKKTDKQYIYIVTEGTSANVQDWNVRYRLLYAKKAYRDLSRYFSILMPDNWDNHRAVVVYYPNFPTHQELEEARNKCSALVGGGYCRHIVFYDKMNTYCFTNVSTYGPTIFDIFQYIKEHDWGAG